MRKTKNIEVSVILPSYNRGEIIEKTIKSLINQRFPGKKVEIIVIDDGSSNETLRILLDLCDKYKNILLLRNEKNLGPSASRNKGVRYSKGKYLFFTDDDCIVPKNWISDYVRFFEKNNVGGIGGPLKPGSNNIFSKLEKIKDRVLGINHKEAIIGGRELQTGFTNNVAYKKEVFKKVGLFDEKYKVPAGEDIAFKNKVCSKFKIAYLPIPVIHNQPYTLNYFLGILIKQGLEKNPPRSAFKKIWLLILNLPKLTFNITKKVISYRKNG